MPHIEQRGPRSWRLHVEDPANSAGKRLPTIKKPIRVDDEKLLKAPTKLNQFLQAELHSFIREVEAGEYVKPNKMTFTEFVPEWKKNYANMNLGQYTRKMYMENINTHLIPEFGEMQIGQIKTIHIVKLMTKLRTPEGRKDGKNKPLATNTILNIFKALKSILDAAKQWGFIAKNPIDGVDRPVADKKEKREIKSRKKAYSASEAEKAILALYAEPERWKLYFIGVLLGGFRRGEMLGVEWPSVDFEVCGLWIEKQISLDEAGKKTEAELKTEESEAFVPMPRWYMDELKQYQHEWKKEKLQCKKWKGGDKQYVFHRGYGEMYFPSSPTKVWREFLDKHNLPRIRLHDLRHTTAMLLREDGADVKAIQERLRHARAATTQDMYMHESKLVSRNTADRLEKFNPKQLRSQSVPNA
ncbi:tyrosine-type recombinase/integrase [Paenibacillus alkalitolerans]|uniref:tyrosine-type recombinase/integrase n=1 Tax=Paenibacillus alkalitolerans TaxID=2799335 RepID=UPI0018F790D5|nr:site-specific integrase [Paenibacillus alkalitolerans]